MPTDGKCFCFIQETVKGWATQSNQTPNVSGWHLCIIKMQGEHSHNTMLVTTIPFSIVPSKQRMIPCWAVAFKLVPSWSFISSPWESILWVTGFAIRCSTRHMHAPAVYQAYALAPSLHGCPPTFYCDRQFSRAGSQPPLQLPPPRSLPRITTECKWLRSVFTCRSLGPALSHSPWAVCISCFFIMPL